MKVNDLVSIKSAITLTGGRIINSGSVGIIVDTAYMGGEKILYKVHIPGINDLRFKAYYYSDQHIEAVSGSI